MSLLIAIPGRDSVAVAVDSAVATGSAPVSASDLGACKLFSLGHLGAVMAGRGQLRHLVAVYAQLVGRVNASFDELAAALPAMCALSRDHLVAELGAVGEPPPPSCGTVLLAGWSTRRRRMITLVSFDETVTKPFECFEIERPIVAPCSDDFDEAGLVGGDLAAIERAALHQVRNLPRSEYPALGGRLVSARLSRAGLRIDITSLASVPSTAFAAPHQPLTDPTCTHAQEPLPQRRSAHLA